MSFSIRFSTKHPEKKSGCFSFPDGFGHSRTLADKNGHRRLLKCSVKSDNVIVSEMAERASVLRSRCFFYLILKEEAHGYSDCDRRGDHPDLCGSARDAGSAIAETGGVPMAPTVTALVNQKGGVAKSTSCINLGAALVQAGKRVLLVDTDPQASMTIALGNQQPDNLPITMADLMAKVMNDQQLTPGEGILHHSEGMDLLPSSIALAGTEVSLVNAMSRESTLKFLLNDYRKDYDHILIDCMPSLGMLTINALAAANRVIIPVQANYLSAKGLEQLLQTISKVRRQINPKLQIDGIMLTMVDGRTNNAKMIGNLIRDTYGGKIKVFSAEIPHSVRAAEISAEGKSIFLHDPGGKVAEAYRALTKEVMQLEAERTKHKPDPVR